MIKPPFSYLFYSILSFLLFAYGCYAYFIQRTGFPLPVLLFPLILSLGLLLCFFVKQKS